MTIHPYYFSIQKRVFDLVVASSVLLITSPVWFLISSLILLTSGGPIIYNQKRTGQNQKTFTMHKFRTMYKGAHKRQWYYRPQNQAPEPMFKLFNDPRYVGIGKWLSKTGLDELPQLLNVVKGEMSLVGPRPLPVKEVKNLSSAWNFRHQVKPGVFSEWTLSPKRHYSLSDWKKLDQSTLSQGGILHDLQFMIRSCGQVLSYLTKF